VLEYHGELASLVYTVQAKFSFVLVRLAYSPWKDTTFLGNHNSLLIDPKYTESLMPSPRQIQRISEYSLSSSL